MLHDHTTITSVNSGLQYMTGALVMVMLATTAHSEQAKTAVPSKNTMKPAAVAEMARDINELIAKKVHASNQKPRPPIDDYAFVRRAYLNVVGRIPTLEELNAFITDPAKDKRSLLIRQLLSSKGHHSHMYSYWADLLRVKSTGDELHYAGNYAQAIKTAIRQNKPYDVFAKEIIGASGNLYDKGNGIAGYKAREPMHLDRVSNTVKTFLGMGLDCAQCHDHPTEDWTQVEFYRLAAYSSQVRLRIDPPPPLEKKEFAKLRKALKQEDFDKWIVYREAIRMKFATIAGSGTGYMRLPHDYKYDDAKPHDAIPAMALFGEAMPVSYKVPHGKIQNHTNKKFVGPSVNALVHVADWMTAADNPMFAKATVNRLWKWIMGSELVGPLGNLTLESDGPHPELTNKLIEILKSTNFDTRTFFEVLLNTKAYQSRSHALKDINPEYMLDAPIMRRMSAENIWDSVLSLREANPDKFVPTDYHYDGFTHMNEKSQNWTAADFATYARTAGLDRQGLSREMHKEATARNPSLGAPHQRRASESEHVAVGKNHGYVEVGQLFGASTRELIDASNGDPNIPQILYMMNGKPLASVLTGKSHLMKNVKHAPGPKKLDILWLSILNRPITPAERKRMNQAGRSPKALQHIAWALLNANEFRFVR